MLQGIKQDMNMKKINHHMVLACMMLMPMSSANAAGDIQAGKAAFAKCASCHQVGPSARSAFGPQLNGIIGRKAGASADFQYSAAMKNANFVWTEEKLRAFIKAPGDVVPGNRMRFFGIGNAQQLDNLLAYLRTFDGSNQKR